MPTYPPKKFAASRCRFLWDWAILKTYVWTVLSLLCSQRHGPIAHQIINLDQTGLWPWVLKAGGPTCYGGFILFCLAFMCFCSVLLAALNTIWNYSSLLAEWCYMTMNVVGFKFKDPAPPLWHPPTIYLISLIYIFLNIIEKL